MATVKGPNNGFSSNDMFDLKRDFAQDLICSWSLLHVQFYTVYGHEIATEKVYGPNTG